MKVLFKLFSGIYAFEFGSWAFWAFVDLLF